LFHVPPVFTVTSPTKVFAPIAEEMVKTPRVPAPIVVVPFTVNAKPAAVKLADPLPIDRLPLMVRADPVVVILETMIRLLKLEKKMAGRVLLVVNSTVPKPGVHVPGLVTFNLWQIKIPPFVMSILPECPTTPTVTIPLTVSWDPALKIKSDPPAPLLFVPRLTQAANALSTVTVFPPAMSAASLGPMPWKLKLIPALFESALAVRVSDVALLTVKTVPITTLPTVSIILPTLI